MNRTDMDIDLGDVTIQEASQIAALAAGARHGGEPIRLTPQEFGWVSALARHYRRHFGRRLDVEQFVASHTHARVVLQESLNSGNQALAEQARQFLDENGQPRFSLGKGSVGVDLEF